MALILIFNFPLIFAFVIFPKLCESSLNNRRNLPPESASVTNFDDMKFTENRLRRHGTYRDRSEKEIGDFGEQETTGPEFTETGDVHDDQEFETENGTDDEWTDTETDIRSTEVPPGLASLQPTAVAAAITTTTTQSANCPKCSNRQEEEKQLKIEMIKQHLLNKLGLASPPEVGGPLPPLPFDFYVGEDFYASDQSETSDTEPSINQVKTRQIFIFGKDITDTCANKKSTGCYSFDTASSGIDPDLVSSIELWIYKQPDVNDHHIQEFMVSELEPTLKNGKRLLRFRNIVKRIDTRLKYGWMKIYVKRSVLRWLSKPHRNHGLAVVCKTCQRQNHKTIYGNKEGYMPILVFYMKQQPRGRRPKRETRCIEGGTNCCHMEPLEIYFRDIGWDYIMAPDRIRPNFCTGSCNGILAAYHNHTRLVQTLQQSVTHRFGSVQTCCSPVSFARPQSLLYRDNMGMVRKVDVPDLIVGECGCT